MYGIGPRVAAGLAVAATGAPSSPTVAPSSTAVVTGPQIAAEPTLHAPCACKDGALDRMLALMAGGLGQWDASWAIWRGTT